MIHPDWNLYKHLLLKIKNDKDCHKTPQKDKYFKIALSSHIRAHITQDLTIFSVDIKCLKIQSEYFKNAIPKISLFNKIF